MFCKYCHPDMGYMMLNIDTDDGKFAHVFIDTKSIVMVTNLGDEYEEDEVDIKFCPFCGRLMRPYNEDVLGEIMYDD